MRWAVCGGALRWLERPTKQTQKMHASIVVTRIDILILRGEHVILQFQSQNKTRLISRSDRQMHRQTDAQTDTHTCTKAHTHNTTQHNTTRHNTTQHNTTCNHARNLLLLKSVEKNRWQTVHKVHLCLWGWQQDKQTVL